MRLTSLELLLLCKWLNQARNRLGTPGTRLVALGYIIFYESALLAASCIAY